MPDRSSIMVSMANVLSTERRAQVVAALVEGNSIRATVRMTGVAKNTITKLLVDLGDACSEYQDGVMQNLGCDRIEVDEIWAFCHAKAKNVPEEHQGEWGWGDVWTYVALDADTKLVPTWMVGYRDFENAKVFLRDLATRLAHRVQLTTDGLGYYKNSVPFVFGPDVDFAQIIKHYKNTGTDRTYSPAKCTGVEIKVRQGNPDRDLISTSYVERQNLTMRMGMRRFTRLTNAFSKKVENLAAAVSLHFMHYNFVRVHQTLGTTPAVAAGVADHVWTVREICELLLTPKSN
jgi:IS1 family transposase